MASHLKFHRILLPPAPSLLFPSSSLLPKYENCKSVLFISISPRQCAPQGRGSHGNPANSCLKNSSCLMQLMCLIDLKVSWGWEDEARRRVLLGPAGARGEATEGGAQRDGEEAEEDRGLLST